MMRFILSLLRGGMLIFVSCASLQQKQAAPEKKTVAAAATVQGTWVLDYVLDKADAATLYPVDKPELEIAGPAGGAVQGSSGCNRIAARVKVLDSEMRFADVVTLTRKSCAGSGEAAFIAALKRVNHYALSGDGRELTCIQGDIIVLRFLRKNK